MMTKPQKYRFIRTAALFLALALILAACRAASLAGNAAVGRYVRAGDASGFKPLGAPSADAADPAGFTAAAIGAPGYEKAAENENLCLFADRARSAVKVLDKRTNHVWSGTVDDKSMLNSGIAEGILDNMRSMLAFSYIDLTGSMTEKETCSFTEEHTVTNEVIRSGIRFNFHFTKLNIKIAVELTLNGDMFCVTAPSDLIGENETGSEEAEALKERISKIIGAIQKQCEEIENLTRKNPDVTESLLSLVVLSSNNIIEGLMMVSQKIGTGEVDMDKVTEAGDSVEILRSVIGEQEGIAAVLDDIQAKIAEMRALAGNMKSGRSAGITKLRVLPYFGCQTSSTDGYAFYPDQSGAISYFDKAHTATAGAYLQDVYDVFLQVVPLGALPDDFQAAEYKRPATMPVFGVKAGNSAFAGIVTAGEYDCAVGYNPALDDLDCANVYSQYYLRKKTTIVNSAGGQSELYDNKRTRGDWQTAYVMLAGERADYSGMAVAYRNYLEETGRLSRSALMDAPMPMGIEFFMGAKSGRNSIGNKYVAVSTYAYIQEYLRGLSGRGVENILLSVTDWTENNGVEYPDAPVPAGRTGGAKGLLPLAEYCKEQGYTLALTAAVVGGLRSSLNSSTLEKATVKNKNQLTIEYYGYHILNPGYIFHHTAENLLGRLKKLGVNAVNYTNLATSLYFDYNEAAPADRSGTALTFRNLAKRTQREMGAVVNIDANDYMLSATDWNMYVPEEDSRFLFTDETVPFRQIVLHGSVVYTGGADNQRYSQTKQMLKSVEYGYVPFYFLTEKETLELRNTVGWDGFHATLADTWLEKSADAYARLKSDLAEVWNRKITAHRSFENGVALTEYENGVRVYVNYAARAQTADGVEIGSESYRVISGGEVSGK